MKKVVGLILVIVFMYAVFVTYRVVEVMKGNQELIIKLTTLNDKLAECHNSRSLAIVKLKRCEASDNDRKME